MEEKVASHMPIEMGPSIAAEPARVQLNELNLAASQLIMDVLPTFAHHAQVSSTVHV